MDFEQIRNQISKAVDEDIKSMYAGTYTTSEQEPFTLAHMERAVQMLQTLSVMPPAPDFVFSPHIGDDEAYQADETVIPFFENGVVFVGKNVRDELEAKNIPVIHFNKRRNENDDETIRDQEKSSANPD